MPPWTRGSAGSTRATWRSREGRLTNSTDAPRGDDAPDDGPTVSAAELVSIVQQLDDVEFELNIDALARHYRVTKGALRTARKTGEREIREQLENEFNHDYFLKWIRDRYAFQFDASRDRLYWWDGARWSPHGENKALVEFQGEAKRQLGETPRATMLRNLVELLKRVPGVNAERVPWDSRDDVVYFRNAIFDPVTGRTRKHDWEHWNTTCLDLEYSPRREEECPQWELLLEDRIPEKDDRLLLQEYLGYCLLPSVRYQKSLFVIGPPATGKSTIFEIVQHVLGDNIWALVRAQDLEYAHATAPLPGKLVAYCDDLEGSRSFSALGAFRELVTAGRLHINPKGKPAYTARNTVHLIQVANQFPPISSRVGADEQEGLFRRLLIIVMDRPLEERVPGLARRIAADEQGGIVTWMVKGLRRLVRNEGKFTYDEEKTRDLWLVNSRPAFEFLAECTERGTGFEIETGALYTAYETWCEALGYEVDKKNVFGRYVHQWGATTKQRRHDKKRTRYYRGLRLAPRDR
jgi:putative DNA primase/helicase